MMKRAENFDQLVLEYQPPNEFYTFDSCLMFLKKINEYIPSELEEDNHKVVSDLGVAAYLLMLEYDDKRKMGIRVIGKKGKNVYFSHPEGVGSEFERRSYQYLPSQFHTYDSNLMALKKNRRVYAQQVIPRRTVYRALNKGDCMRSFLEHRKMRIREGLPVCTFHGRRKQHH